MRHKWEIVLIVFTVFFLTSCIPAKNEETVREIDLLKEQNALLSTQNAKFQEGISEEEIRTIRTYKMK